MEHVQEFWPQRRPMRSRPQATIARRKGIFTCLSEGTFTKLPENNIINLYQTYIEGVLLAEKNAIAKLDTNKQRPNKLGVDFSTLFKSVWESFGRFQVFHSAGEVNRLVRWALRDLKRQGRIQRTRLGRYTSAPPPEQPTALCPPPPPALHRFISSPRWSSQRRHLVNSIHRWDQYNQRRSQRLSRSPSEQLAAAAAAAVDGSATAGGGGGGGGGAGRGRPRMEAAPAQRPLSAPSLSQLYGLMPRLFPSG